MNTSRTQPSGLEVVLPVGHGGKMWKRVIPLSRVRGGFSLRLLRSVIDDWHSPRGPFGRCEETVPGNLRNVVMVPGMYQACILRIPMEVKRSFTLRTGVA